MTAEYVASIALFVTVFGWLVTYLAQKEQMKLTHNLQKLLSEHDTRFSHLHKRRADAIDALYKTMDHLLGLLQASIRGGRFQGEPSPEEQQTQAFQKFLAFQESFYQNRLYFDEDLCKHIEKLIQQYFDVFSKVGLASNLRQFISDGAAFHIDPTVITSHKKLMDETTEIIVKELPPIQRLIEKRLRHVLGSFDTSKKLDG